MNKRSLIFFSFACFILPACGGGSGDSDECAQYCTSSCDKASSCGFFPANEIDMCEESCNAGTDQYDRPSDSCAQTQALIQALSCQELAAVLGFGLGKSADSMISETVGKDFSRIQE